MPWRIFQPQYGLTPLDALRMMALPSQCNRCHQGATDGVYNEDQVRIPGSGRWED